MSFLCPSQLDAIRFHQLFQRILDAVHAGLLIVKVIVTAAVAYRAATSEHITLNQSPVALILFSDLPLNRSLIQGFRAATSTRITFK